MLSRRLRCKHLDLIDLTLGFRARSSLYSGFVRIRGEVSAFIEVMSHFVLFCFKAVNKFMGDSGFELVLPKDQTNIEVFLFKMCSFERQRDTQRREISRQLVHFLGNAAAGAGPGQSQGSRTPSESPT